MTDPTLLRACQDAPWDMVARGIYADWLDDHGEARVASKFRDPNDGDVLLSLLPEPFWHPPFNIADEVYELPMHIYREPLSERLCVAIQGSRSLARSPDAAPVESESLEKMIPPKWRGDSNRWVLTWARVGRSFGQRLPGDIGLSRDTPIVRRNYTAQYTPITAEEFRAVYSRVASAQRPH